MAHVVLPVRDGMVVGHEVAVAGSALQLLDVGLDVGGLVGDRQVESVVARTKLQHVEAVRHLRLLLDRLVSRHDHVAERRRLEDNRAGGLS